jgi:DNA-binding transcriptional LysR family regulator
MKVTLSQLRLLLTVVEAGSISAAARQSRLTQSGASQALIALERALGGRLLARTRDGAAPTALALSLLDDARAALAAVGRIEERAAWRRAPPNSTLRVASVPSAAARLLPVWSRAFRRLYPEIEVSVFEGHHLEVGDWVARGLADVGLAAVAPDGLGAEAIRDEAMLFVARRGHPALRGGGVRLAALRTETLVAAGLGCDPILQALFAAAGAPMPNLVRAQDVGTALEMVRQGVGVTILPETVFPRPDMDDLRVRPISPLAQRRLYLIASEVKGAAARFRDVVKSVRAPSAARH